MKRFALGIEYNGSGYHGWQLQKEVYSIQEEIENALSIIADHKVNVICAGRTDTGVHSIGQVIHFDTQSIRKESAWTIGVNRYLSKNISIKWVKEVPLDFHARYSAIERSYRYIIYNYNFRTSIFHHGCYHVHQKLDVYKMHSASQYLLGEHDFSSFKSINCQSNSSYRTIIQLRVSCLHSWVMIDITANSFLHHMVRNIAGSLIEIGLLNKKENWIKKLLYAKNRNLAGPTAVAKGLYLVSVKYPIFFGLP
ncbi:tRNA pseudouridine(38-40) synthase TruA [Buchnera aphidicola]|uniref:tRNA pseudouridine(38-40) synthase TruA n=1 Tax=Buchnera aphidicola TaxID=9 RepID=UPI003BEF05BE